MRDSIVASWEAQINKVPHLYGWFPLGNCMLSVGSGSPHIHPPVVMDSLGPEDALSVHYILVTSRTQNWMGPAQLEHTKSSCYLGESWVYCFWTQECQHCTKCRRAVDQWKVEISDGRWHEIGGSFRIEKQPSKVMVYVQGPGSGVDVMLGSLHIFIVDRKAGFKHLRKQTDKLPPNNLI